jgi:hypothetical protein
VLTYVNTQLGNKANIFNASLTGATNLQIVHVNDNLNIVTGKNIILNGTAGISSNGNSLSSGKLFYLSSISSDLQTQFTNKQNITSNKTSFINNIVSSNNSSISLSSPGNISDSFDFKVNSKYNASISIDGNFNGTSY